MFKEWSGPSGRTASLTKAVHVAARREGSKHLRFFAGPAASSTTAVRNRFVAVRLGCFRESAGMLSGAKPPRRCAARKRVDQVEIAMREGGR
jgi:hypothetical protein